MIVAGFGFRAGANQSSFADALVQTGRKPDAVATLASKSPYIKGFADALHLPVIEVDATTAASQKTLTTSAASLAEHNTGSVAEATALAAAGRGARLTGARQISSDRMATCAIAIGDD